MFRLDTAAAAAASGGQNTGDPVLAMITTQLFDAPLPSASMTPTVSMSETPSRPSTAHTGERILAYLRTTDDQKLSERRKSTTTPEMRRKSASAEDKAAVRYWVLTRTSAVCR